MDYAQSEQERMDRQMRMMRAANMINHFSGAMRFGGGAGVSIAQNQPLPTDGSLPMASGYLARADNEIVTRQQLRAILADIGIPLFDDT